MVPDSYRASGRKGCRNPWVWYRDGLTFIVRQLAHGFGVLGGFIHDYPVATLLSSLTLGCLVCICWAHLTIETKGDNLWVPKHSLAKDDRDWVKANYNVSVGGAAYIASIKPEYKGQFNNNVLQLAITWELFQLDKLIKAQTFQIDGQTLRYADVCDKDKTGACVADSSGYFNFWNQSFDIYLASVGGSATDPQQGNYTNFLHNVTQTQFPDGRDVSVLSIFGMVTLSSSPLRLSAAEVIQVGYSLNSTLTDSQAADWYKAFIDTVSAYRDTTTYTHLEYTAQNSVDLEIARSVSGDAGLIGASIIIFFIIAILGCSRWDRVKTRSTLSILGVLAGCLGIAAGYGLAILFGQRFTSLAEVLPYVLLGIVVDVLFITVKAYDVIDYEHPELPTRDKFVQLMETAGLSVTTTLLASALAFSLGAICDVPSVSWFSVYACMGVVSICVLMLTLMMSLFVLTERRIAAGRIDWILYPCICCCLRRSHSSTSTAEAVQAVPAAADVSVALDVVSMEAPTKIAKSSSAYMSSSEVSAAAAAAAAAAATFPVPKQESFVKMLFRKYYAPFLAMWPVKVIVIAIFVAYIAASGYGTRKLVEGQPISDLAPSGSYVIAFSNIQTDTFDQQVGEQTNIYFRYMDQSNPVIQAKMIAVLDTMLQNDFINATLSGFSTPWLLSFLRWVGDTQPNVTLTSDGCFNPYTGLVQGELGKLVNTDPVKGCVPEALFYPLLNQFLASPGHGGTIQSLEFSADRQTLISSKFPLVHTAPGDDGTYPRRRFDAMNAVRDQINSQIFGEQNAAAPDAVFVLWNDNYIFDGGDAGLKSLIIEYILLALLGVFVVCLVLLVNPLASIYMVVAVGMVDLFLFGEMWWGHIRFNQVSIINIVLATGLAVDYTVYFAQKFMVTKADGTLNGRMKVAMAETGSAVFLGGITAAIGVLPLAGARSVILLTFFKLIMGTILFSLAIGLILMPVVFSLIGPPAIEAAPLKASSSSADQQSEPSKIEVASLSSSQHKEEKGPAFV